ncbi:phage portal protein [Rhizobium sp. Kim5]|uniref:phage portal protein n=1 Tax=Rhizobium sp. Kim5 TaxID=2020311 RepID=UPI000A2A29B7|nr:phage portal protein [Rhizobium sp. Kim5]ARQ56886.1 phage portal protein [Rhizobium sp. Kim5]
MTNAAQNPSVAQTVRRTLSSWSKRASNLFTVSRGGTYYEAAAENPRIEQPGDVGPNARNAEFAVLRAQSRWMFANDPYYRQACNQVGRNVVHHGIKPIVRNKVLRKLWKQWCREADARGQLTFEGLQFQAAVAMARDGEVLARLRPRLPSDMKSKVPFQIQLLEADYLPLEKTLRGERGTLIINGVERNQIDRTVAYWLFDHHPRDLFLTGSALPNRVPASEVLHIYLPDRIGDTRGYPWGASALKVTQRARTYDEVQLERMIVSSSRGGYYKKPRLAGDEETMFEGGESEFQALEPNEWIEIPEGWDIEQAQPIPGDANYSDVKREYLSALAVAFGFYVEMVNMNHDKMTSDRQYRAVQLEMIRHIESIQHHVMVARLCQPTWERFVSSVYLAGLFAPEAEKTVEDYYDVEWMTPKRGHIHPLQEIQAVVEAIKNGIMSRKRAVAQLGEDVEDIDAEIALETARAMFLKLGYPVYGLDKVAPDVSGAGEPPGEADGSKPSSPFDNLLKASEDLDGDDLEFEADDLDHIDEMEPA